MIGYSVDKLLKLLDNISSIKKSYAGIYYSYRYSTSEDNKIILHRWKIFRKLNGSIGVVIEEMDHENPFKYKGIMRVQDRYIYIHLSAISHSEEMFYIFPEPIDNSIVSLRGILLAISMNNKPWSGEEILINKKISIQKARNILGSVTNIKL